MDIQDILVGIIVLLCILYTGKHFLGFFRKKKGKSTGCGCNCAGCHKAEMRKDCDGK